MSESGLTVSVVLCDEVRRAMELYEEACTRAKTAKSALQVRDIADVFGVPEAALVTGAGLSALADHIQAEATAALIRGEARAASGLNTGAGPAVTQGLLCAADGRAISHSDMAKQAARGGIFADNFGDFAALVAAERGLIEGTKSFADFGRALAHLFISHDGACAESDMDGMDDAEEEAATPLRVGDYVRRGSDDVHRVLALDEGGFNGCFECVVAVAKRMPGWKLGHASTTMLSNPVEVGFAPLDRRAAITPDAHSTPEMDVRLSIIPKDAA